jgi:iron-sulfur cluster assembly protein
MALELTTHAVEKVKEIMGQQSPQPLGLRVAVVGGGCSGFSYQMNFEDEASPIDKTYEFDGLKVFVDHASLMYLNGTKIDFVESLEGSGFKFDNPNVKTTCGCGSSFTV